MSSMTVQESGASKPARPPVQQSSPFSLSVLKTFVWGNVFFQYLLNQASGVSILHDTAYSGRTPISSEPPLGKLPDYCTTRYDLFKKLGYPFYPGIPANVECYLDSVKEFQAHFKSSAGIDRLLDEFTLGRRLACPNTHIGPLITTGQEQIELSKEMRRLNLEGIGHMYNSGCLEVIYPKPGQTVNQCYDEYRSTRDAGTINYQIDGCYYFVTGTLICPDKGTFDHLRAQFFDLT
jgi:hypothetical protein